jgi:hypothetical protein
MLFLPSNQDSCPAWRIRRCDPPCRSWGDRHSSRSGNAQAQKDSVLSGPLQAPSRTGIGKVHRIPLAGLKCMSPKRVKELAPRWVVVYLRA